MQNIDYPFWGGNRPDYCGHPGFMLDCQVNKAPQITILSQAYQVLEINYMTQTLMIARQDFWNSTCPKNLQNTTIDFTLFSYASNVQNLTLFFGCSQIPVLQLGSSRQFNCSVNGIDDRNFYLTRSTPFSNSTISCFSSVIVPVFQSAAQALEGNSSSSTSLKAALDGGFGLQWSANSDLCSQCVASGGQCGYESGSSSFTCFCSDKAYASSCSATQNGSTKGLQVWLKIGIAFSLSLPGMIIFIIIKINCRRRRCIASVKAVAFWKKDRDDDQNVKAFMRQYGSLAPKRYSHSDIEKMTNSFKDKLGQGGYGTVYKGKISDGGLVAVKLLNEAKGNGEEFINEVASISKTSHVNVVTLLGFCYERNKRALVYEFMPNGSLDKFIYDIGGLNTKTRLEWKTMYQISVGIARGLEYLHGGCNTRIVHFDIKPHNILLDEDFCPKISDFGLAKLCQKKESVISMLGTRGTVGYIAPEVFSRAFGGVSHKSDVYSYGMMVLEMTGARNTYEGGVVQSSEMYFPHLFYENLKHGEDLRLDGVTNEEEEETSRKMIIVGLWCIQTNPSDRPSMSKVVEMLEGNIQCLQVPPKPFLFSPARSVEDSSYLSVTIEGKEGEEKERGFFIEESSSTEAACASLVTQI
ncbi:LEAF RUST 10 DISEASE-RESISTANCE LOCUS RECEPTOR-LIKE PROTEIN KINASE-like 2.5 [Camellia lanceoleosa]|uniref:LEAF RUST 10 DISEASE-RESISTANCE LOCUS RECEPTOR-LIKE PROTEIN KINASE-like 2.5 n=1 Tax=Camellia lanceoleosa TaxID=1840588 RepID=A0ACC0HYB8_9ERIC|nr:LEAF RUST 10 DISEASE-RESISTANCE LOCUS RECEPTOR-LIKE PROTEIN KINASE-like 2.5 [Camellia lanceoleosa]